MCLLIMMDVIHVQKSSKNKWGSPCDTCSVLLLALSLFVLVPLTVQIKPGKLEFSFSRMLESCTSVSIKLKDFMKAGTFQGGSLLLKSLNSECPCWKLAAAVILSLWVQRCSAQVFSYNMNLIVPSGSWPTSLGHELAVKNLERWIWASGFCEKQTLSFPFLGWEQLWLNLWTRVVASKNYFRWKVLSLEQL